MVGDIKVRKGYKKTEVGVIPEDWEVVTLDDVGEFRRGKGIAKKELTNEGVPCVLYGEIYTKYDFVAKYLSSFTSHECSEKSIKINKGDVLFTGSGETVEDIGKSFTYLGNEMAFAGGDIILMTPYSQYDSVFLGYLTNYDLVNEQKAKLAQGSSVIHIYIDGIKGIIIPSPPLEEQKAIAKALTDTGNLIYSIQNLIDKKEKIKQGTMQELLTGKNRLDGFGGEWEIKKIGELLSYEQPTNYINESPILDKGVIPVLTANKAFILGFTRETHGVFTRIPAIIFDDFTTASKKVEVPFKVRSSALKILKTRNENIDLNFVFETMQILKFNIGDHKRYYLSEYQFLDILVPPLDEQKAISKILLDMDQEIQGLKEKLEKYKTIKQGMMQELLTGRVRLI